MANAKRDDNYVPALLAESNAGTGATVVLWADPTTHRLLVDVSGGAGSSATDDSAFTAATDSGTPMMGFVTADSVDSGDVGVVGMLANRQLKVSIFDSSGVEVTSFGGGTQYTEDAAAAANPVGNALIVVREDARAGGLTNTDGDNVALRGSNAGELYTVDANTGAIKTAVEIMDDWDESDRAKVNLIVGQAGIAAGAGAVGATVPRVTLASDDPAVVSLAVLDDWDESDRAKVNIIVGQAGVTAGAGAVAANTQRVTLASDDPAVTALQLIDDTVYASDAAISKVLGIGAQFDDTAPGTTTENSVRALRMSTRRELYVQLRDAAGNERGLNIDASGRITVVLPANSGVDIGDVDVLSIVPGTGATNLGKAEDAIHNTGDVGVMALAVRRDTAAASSGASGDYEPLSTDATGRLWIVGAGVEDVAETAGGTLLMAGTVRRDTAASSAGTTGDNATLNTDASGRLWVTATVIEDVAHSVGEALQGNGVRRIDTPASSAGTSGDWATMDASAEGALYVTPIGTTAGGLTIFRSIDLDETEEEVKATAGVLYGIWFSNMATSTRFLKIYNATAANVTVGTTTPVITLALPGNSSDDISGALNNGGMGIGFATAITVAATTGIADNDTGAPGANEVIVNIFYK